MGIRGARRDGIVLLVGKGRRGREGQVSRVRRGSCQANRADRIVPAQRVWPFRYFGQRGRVGSRLLERLLPRRPAGRLGLEHGRLHASRFARRFVCEQGQCRQIGVALQIRLRCPILRQWLSGGSRPEVTGPTSKRWDPPPNDWGAAGRVDPFPGVYWRGRSSSLDFRHPRGLDLDERIGISKQWLRKLP